LRSAERDGEQDQTDRQINPAHSPVSAGCGCAARFGEAPWAMQSALCARDRPIRNARCLWRRVSGPAQRHPRGTGPGGPGPLGELAHGFGACRARVGRIRSIRASPGSSASAPGGLPMGNYTALELTLPLRNDSGVELSLLPNPLAPKRYWRALGRPLRWRDR
jgi:hypothetical protein